MAAGTFVICSEFTTEIDAGASRIFSGVAPRVTVVTTSLSLVVISTIGRSTLTAPDPETLTPSTRLAAKPIRVAVTTYVPATSPVIR